MTAYALFKRSPKMIVAVLLVRFATDVLDLVFGLVGGTPSSPRHWRGDHSAPSARPAQDRGGQADTNLLHPPIRLSNPLTDGTQQATVITRRLSSTTGPGRYAWISASLLA